MLAKEWNGGGHPDDSWAKETPPPSPSHSEDIFDTKVPPLFVLPVVVCVHVLLIVP